MGAPLPVDKKKATMNKIFQASQSLSKNNEDGETLKKRRTETTNTGFQGSQSVSRNGEEGETVEKGSVEIRRCSLLIGNDDYQNPNMKLDDARCSVSVMADTLRKFGYETECHANLTANQIDVTLSMLNIPFWTSEQPLKCVVYFSGHSVHNAAGSPCELRGIDGKASIWLENTLKVWQMRKHRSGDLLVVILDSCRLFKTSQHSDHATPTQYKQLRPVANCVVISSGSSKWQSTQHTRTGASPFSQTLTTSMFKSVDGDVVKISRNTFLREETDGGENSRIIARTCYTECITEPSPVLF